MNNALLYLGGILISVLAVLFAVPRFVDWNSYRGIFEEEATRVLGREVRVGGSVNVRLLPAPYVSFERLRIADVGDEGGNSIIRVESFTMWLSVPPLLRGVLEAHRVEVRRPIVNLAINAQGGGNWRTLALTPGTLSFAPKDVALQSVQIHDGAIIVSGPSRGELARFDTINGELTAEALEGPYKFKGQVNWGDTTRNVRLATAKVDPNGDLRFKAAIDVLDSTNSYVLDGRLKNIRETPTLEGDLTAKLALGAHPPLSPSTADPVLDVPPQAHPDAQGAPGAPSAHVASPPAPVVPAVPAQTGHKAFELKAKVLGTTQSVALQDIAVSLEAGTTPQLITGEGKADWSDKMRLDVTLASRWLDLDQLTDTSSAKTPLEAGRSYFEVLAAALPAEADTNARLEFDQLTLGGEPISNVRLAASRTGGPLELKGVRADLPGGVRLELDGVLTPSSKTTKVPRLDGTLFVSGKSLMRFLAWGLNNANVGRERNDGPFTLDGRFGLGDGTLALTDASFAFAGTPLNGDLKLDLGERKKLVMAIEGPRVDVAHIGSGLVGLNVLRGLFGKDAVATDAASPASSSQFFDPANADLSLAFKVAELVDGDRVLTNVDTEIRLDRGTLTIPRLRFSTREGLQVDADGEAKNVPAQPEGSIRGLISAPNAEAARAFVSLLDLDDTPAADLDRLARLAPLRLAGTLQLKGGPSNATELTLDGSLGGGRMSAALRLDRGQGQWRSAPLDIQATLDNPDVAGLMATLFDAKLNTAAGDAPKAGRVVVKAAGVPADGLLSLADVTSDGLSLSYRGKVRLPAPSDIGLDGDLQIAAPDARVALALAGLSTGDGAAGVPVNGTIQVRRDAGSLRLGSQSITLGESTLSGDLSVAARDSGGKTIQATLTTNKASFATLLSPILSATDASAQILGTSPAAQAPQARQVRQPDAPNAAVPETILWPEQSFDLSVLDRLDGKIDLSIGALVVEPGLTMRNARLVTELSPGGIKVASLEGDAVGGRMTSQLNIAKAPAGIDLTGALRIDISSKPQPAGGQVSPPPGDAVAFNVSFSSRALSPAAAMAAVTGKGELTIGDATLNGNSPAAVAGVVREALTGQGPSSGNGLTEAIRTSLRQGEVKLGKLAVPVDISDGALKLEKVRIEMADGRSTFATAVELATMKVDSEWQIEPKLEKGVPANPARAFLPPVTVVYTGKLSEFSTLVPTVSAGALERELVVRKMELDVGELERLRKLDQERARQDAERRKALEEDQAATPPPVPVPVPAPAAAPQNNPSPPAAAPQAFEPGAWDTFDGESNQANGAHPSGNQEAGASQTQPPTVAPSPAAERPRPQRRKRPAEEEWRPFQTPY
ncbi:AsmA family protein [Hyphomicrobium sp.]|uniref:AsmA family protein n=1 Tax=Hyphomicrobium sp. TaxID=82 RepID=UPI002E342226|nr:AsmA family protein [Hyphomicrobium sp.]HEX2840239.1 AsmA family protein [Hyphomicrobium sp.]